MIKNPRRLRHNLTLLELVIALAILAAVAALVLDNFSEQELRERHRQTLENGRRIRQAITGLEQPDGISPFLSDMGRYPRVYIPGGGVDAGKALAQLYDRGIWKDENNNSMLSQPAELELTRGRLDLPFEPELSGLPKLTTGMKVGWNGPYLNCLTANFYDGWGHGWRILKYEYDVNKTPSERYSVLKDSELEKETVINGIVSFGADNRENATTPEDYLDKDEYFEFAEELNTATLYVTLKARSGSTWQNIKTAEAAAALKAGIPEYSEPAEYTASTVVRYLNEYYIARKFISAAETVRPGDDESGTSWRKIEAGHISKNRIGGAPYSAGVRVMLLAPHRYTNGAATDHMSLGYFLFQPAYDDAGELIATEREVELKNASGTADSDGISATVKWGPEEARLEISGLIPGFRQIYGCGYFYTANTAGDKPLQYAASGVEWVALRKGGNHITLYLDKKELE